MFLPVPPRKEPPSGSAAGGARTPVPRQPTGCVGAIIGALLALLAMYVLAGITGIGASGPDGGDDSDGFVIDIFLGCCCGLPVGIGAVSGYLLGRWIERLGGSEQQPDR